MTIQQPTDLTHASMLGLGVYRPERVVTNDEVCEVLDSTDEWIQTRSGIKTRRFAGDDETLIGMSTAAAERALAAGIAAARPGHTMGHIGAAIAAVARADGYGMLANHGGHGIGREMHQDPFVPNEGYAGHGMRLEAGLVLALEPWFLATTDELVTDPDGWTLRSVDGSRGAHSEHTVAITADGPIILTDRSFLGVD